MKLAILGGSFNPLHIGHAMLAETVIKEFDYDKVLFIPTCIPPHKEIQGGSSTEQRLQMVKNFCESYNKVCGKDYFELEPCEVERGGVSYTYDTLTYIHEKYKGVIEGNPGLIMGEEIAAEFYHWKNAEQVAKMADIIIVPRYPSIYFTEQNENSTVNKPTGEYKGDFKSTFDLANFNYPYKRIKNPMVPVSSTEIRFRVANDKSFRYLVPDSIFDYIKKENLYLN